MTHSSRKSSLQPPRQQTQKPQGAQQQSHRPPPIRISRQQAARELARRSLVRFAQAIVPGFEPTPFHTTYYRVLNAFAKGSVRRLIVSVPPQHGKSLGSSVLLPSYVLGIRPWVRIALASYNFKLASRFNRRIQQLIDSQEYRILFPGTKLKPVRAGAGATGGRDRKIGGRCSSGNNGGGAEIPDLHSSGRSNSGADGCGWSICPDVETNDRHTTQDRRNRAARGRAGELPPNLIRTNEEFDLAGAAGGLLAVGREGSLTGNRVDLFILDDLYKDALEAHSPLVRDHAWEWYNAVVRTRLHNDSQELIVCTRWHEDDLIGRIAEHEPIVALTDPAQLATLPPESWLALNFDALKESPATLLDPRGEGEPLWPARHSAELLETKRRLDRGLFEAMYQGRPATKEGLLYGEGFATYDTLPEEILRRGNYTDTADTGDDFLCSLCYAAGRDGLLYLTDAVYTQEPMEATEPMVAEMLRRCDTREACIESNNGGRGFARAVARLVPEVRVGWMHQSRNKEARILSNSATVLRLVRMPRDWQMRWPQLARDLCTYRRLFHSNRHHDAADALTGIVEAELERTRRTIRAVGFRSP